MTVILALASNSHYEENIAMAENRIRPFFSAIVFSRGMMTEPIGGVSQSMYCNVVGKGSTDLTYQQLRNAIKEIERSMGRSAESTSEGIIPIDIDILQYDTEKFKPQDWTRQYNITLLKEIGE